MSDKDEITISSLSLIINFYIIDFTVGFYKMTM